MTASHVPQGMRIDLSSLHVHPVDRAAEMLPLRWYDDAIPYEFPECEQNVHSTDGIHLKYESRPRWGEFYHLAGEGARRKAGLAAHAARGPPGRVRNPLPARACGRTGGLSQNRSVVQAPRGFVGDGSPRCTLEGGSTTDMIHSRVTVVDFDGDGLADLLVGGARGAILAYRNRGTNTQPSFPAAELVFTDDGKPLDVGWSAAPLAVDWDGDGKFDLLCGAERNRVLFLSQCRTGSW